MGDLVGDWLTPMEALHLLEPQYGAGTKAFIADKLRDGIIVARSELMWDSYEPTVQSAWKKREEALLDPDANVERDSIVERLVWRASRNWTTDLANWRWPEDRFVITRRRRPAHRTIIQGLRLRTKDVLDLAKPPSKRAGRRPKYTGYANLFKSLLQLERAGELTIGNFKTKAALETRLLGEVSESHLTVEERLGDETLSRCAWAIWEQVIGPEK